MSAPAPPTALLADPRRGALVLPSLRVVVTRGPQAGATLDLAREELVIGSSRAADLRLDDPTVSRNHLALRATPEGLLVVDLESTNGTRLGGRRVVQAYVESGDVIELGASAVRVEARGGPGPSLPLSPSGGFGELIGSSPAARRLFAALEAVAAESVTVLLTGETGSGKDSCAEELHRRSPRASRPFVVVDCGAIPASLLESELFGHVRGAFTGADRDRQGAFADADGGTLFLDQVDDLPLALQPKLLRALERREIRPLGATQPRRLDVRVIAASRRDLRVEVNHGRFREDLFYRLHVFAIDVPPLRARRSDVPLLAERFLRDLTGDPDAALPDDVRDAFLRHDWPGNVRELKHRVEALAVRREQALDGLSGARPSYREAKAEAVDAFERAFLEALVAEAGGNVSEAARRARMDRPFLIRLLRKHGLSRTSL